MPGSFIVHDLASVEGCEPDWLWPDYIEKGVVSLMTGDPDIGKTYVLLDLAARLADGGTWPDGTPVTVGKVMYVDAENGPREVKRRITATELIVADNFFLITSDEPDTPRWDRFDAFKVELEAKIKALAPVAWVIIDPIVAFHEKNENNATAIRSVMKALAVTKLNSAPKPSPLGFKIINGRVRWKGQVELPKEFETKFDAAVDLLSDLLNDGPILQRAIYQIAQHDGLGYGTLENAKRWLGVKKFKGERGRAMWSLP